MTAPATTYIHAINRSETALDAVVALLDDPASPLGVEAEVFRILVSVNRVFARACFHLLTFEGK